MPAARDEFDRAAVVTIQGGGVYGLSLLGQLGALIDRYQITPIALAGTSAGAIVATLCWAGLTPKGIRDRFCELAKHDSLIDLLGPFQPDGTPFTFADFRALKGRFDGYLADAERGFGAEASIPLWRLDKKAAKLWSGLRSCRELEAAVASLRPHVANRGLFPGERLEQVIDRLIRESPQIKRHAHELPGAHELLQFRHLRALASRHADCYFPPLFLTATNLSTRHLELFNSVEDEYLNVPIARAVRASAGFPVFFRPVDIAQGPTPGWYVDGGVISNYPAWVFAADFRERMDKSPVFANLAARPWVHIGLRLVDDADRSPADLRSPKPFISSLIGMLTGQARNELEARIASVATRSLVVPQRTNQTDGPEQLLDVDCIDEIRIRGMYGRGEEVAAEKLQGISFDLPVAQGAQEINEALRRLIDKALQVLGQEDNRVVALRSNVFVPQREKLVLRYQMNMTGHSDADIPPFDMNTGLTGFCFTCRSPFICNLQRIRELARQGHLPAEASFGMPAEKHLQVEASRTWLASVPIFDLCEISFRPTGELRRVPLSGQHYHQLSSAFDGPVLGIVNLDAAFSYQALELPEDPQQHWTDIRICAILDCLQATATEIGTVLSKSIRVRP